MEYVIVFILIALSVYAIYDLFFKKLSQAISRVVKKIKEKKKGE